MKTWINKITLAIRIRLGMAYIMGENPRRTLKIKKIKKGDTVTGFDTNRGRYIKNDVLGVEKIKVRNDDFYIVNERHWFYKNQSLTINHNVCHAFQIKVGDDLEGFYGDKIRVYSIRKVTQTGYFYRMTIADNHTYFIDNVLVHNASRYWVGGTASWDATAGTKWAATSGGGGGSSKPTSSDDAFLDAASGVNIVTVAAGNTNCLSLDCTGFIGTLAGTAAISIFGNLTLSAGMTRTYTGNLTFASTSIGRTVTLNGKTLGSSNYVFSGSGGGWTLQDTFNGTTGAISLSAGTLNLNGQTVSVSAFTPSSGSTLNMGASTVNLTSNWNASAGATINSGTSTIIVTLLNTARSFTGGGKTYYNLQFVTTGTGNLTVSGNNTFNRIYYTGVGTGKLLVTGSNNADFKVDTPPHTITFTASTTQTLPTTAIFDVNGTAGNLVTLNSTTATNFTLTRDGGAIICHYLSIADSNASGTTAWYAGSTSTDAAGGNTGWIFTSAATITLNETVVLVDSIAKQISKTYNETVTLVDTITKVSTLFRSLTETITLVETLVYQSSIFRVLSETITLADTIVRDISKSFAETITLVEEVIRNRIYGRSFSETVTLVDTIVKTTNKFLSDIITVVDTFARVGTFRRALNEVVTLQERFQGLLNGLDISWFPKYTDQAGSFVMKYASQAGAFTRKYANQAGTFIRKYLDIP